MIRLLFISLLLVTTCVAQDLDTVDFNNFSLGLQTSVKPIFVPPGAGTVVHNVDLSEGVLRVRKGYDSVYVFPGMDGLVGLYGAYYSDGQQQLIGATDSTGVGYGGIYASEMGSHTFGLATDTFWVITDTLEIEAERWNCAEPGINCTDPLNSPFQDTIIYRDSIWVLYVSESHDSVLRITWWADTIYTWINEVAGPWLTATIIDDTIIKIVEDSAGLDIIYKWKFKFVTQVTTYSDNAAAIWPYWSTQSPTSFAMFDDNVYMVNGDQRGVVWNGEIAHSYPLAAFGEPLITPISLTDAVGTDSTYVMDGEYRYALRNYLRLCPDNDACETSSVIYNWGPLGPISAPVKTKNGRFLLRNFAMMAHGSLDTLGLSLGDTLVYNIYRTTSNPGRIDETMRLYNTGMYIKITDDTVQIYLTYGAQRLFDSLALVFVIDSLTDSMLLDIDPTGILAIDNVWAGRDSTGGILRRAGAPTFISGDTVNYTGLSTDSIIVLDSIWQADSSWGLWVGIDPQSDTLGWAYAIAPIDTLTGNEGPLSSWCCIFNNEAVIPEKYYNLTIGLPPLPPNDSGIAYNLYRAMIYQIGPYTAGFEITTDDPASIYSPNGARYIRQAHQSGGGYLFTYWVNPFMAVDTTVIWTPFLVAQIPAVDTIYVDSMRYDSLKLRRPYTQQTPPARLSRLFAYDGFMFGHDGSLLYRSQVDSATKWGFWDFTPVNNNDGDRITVAWPTRTGIRAKKNFSSWTVFSDYTKTEINQGFGCIAPFSHIKGASHYFLSNRGIEKETDGQFLERTVNTFPLSAPLSSFRNRTIADLSEMVGMYLPTEQLALFSLGETTWVYFEEAGARTQEQGGWATWSMTFKGATLFDTEDELNFIPGKTMYFYKEYTAADPDPNIYRYGTATTDNGTDISMEWRSGAFGVDRRFEIVLDIGLWVNSTDNADSVLTAYIYNQDGSKADSTIFRSLSNKTYALSTFGGNATVQWFQIGLSNSGTISNTDINAIDFTVNTLAGETQPEGQ